ncbi:MAG: prepilin-type N-terminal cleavage/methylation domain-containing protein [Planctomycetota bacterium]
MRLAAIREEGFTLLELMIVVTIIAIIMSMGVPMYMRTVSKAKEISVADELKKIADAIDLYIVENNEPPASLADVGMDGMTDPWGNPYEYLPLTGSHAPGNSKGKARKDHNLVPINTDYDLYSRGPDGKTASPLTANQSKDDIVRAQNGAFFGTAEDY